MKIRSSFSFETATLEGSLFVPDRLEKLAQCQLNSELPLRLPAGLTDAGEIGRAFRIATALWKDFSHRRAQANHRVVTRDFLSKIFRDALGYDLGDPADASVATGGAGGSREAPVRLPFRLTAPGRFPVFFASHREGLDHADRFFSGGSLAPRKRTVTAFAQEFLNSEDTALWAIVSDGLRIRLLRDNASLTRPCWLEFDLERILSEERYSDFAVLWRILFASRVGPTPDAKSSDWETLRRTGIEEGVRVRDKLRDGIASALERLGTGFLRAPGNSSLRALLESGRLPVEGYRCELLRLAYRLLFLFVAEERDLLHPRADGGGVASGQLQVASPETPPGGEAELTTNHSSLATASIDDARRRYWEGYSLRRLTRRSRRISAADASFFDLWDSLRIVFRLLGGSEGSPDGGASSSPTNPLGLPALGGIFAADRCPCIDSAALDNASLLGAIRDLRWTVQGGVTQAVDYRNMGAEEFGSIYESLLELVPTVSLSQRLFSFAGAAAGNARKTSASYYTPAPLVDRLVNSALDPLIEKALAAGEPETALLSLSVIDPACGSGHFSLAAGRRIAEALARVRAGEGGTVTPALYRAAFRDVVSHCLYGVDLNPMAVELAKIALWIESVEPGKPLTFLDAHFVCGNSVLGVMDLKSLAAGIPAAAYDALDGDDKERCKGLKKANASAIKQRKLDTSSGQQLNLLDPGSQEADLSARFAEIDAMPERTVADIAAKRAAHEAFLSDAATGPAATAADLLLAAFLLPKPAAPSQAPLGDGGGDEAAGESPLLAATSETGGAGESSPSPCPTSSDLFGALGFPGFASPSEDLVAASRAVCRSAGVLHWPLLFPAVFARGGFDCALANPPWDVLQFAEKEFFENRAPEIASLAGAKRKAAIAKLEETDPFVWKAYKAGVSALEHEAAFISPSGRFPLSARGKLNLYALFTELFTQILRPDGRAGIIVPSGICTDNSTQDIFRSLVESKRLESLYDFENRKPIFPAVDSRFKFCLVSIGNADTSDFSFFLHDLPEILDRRRHFTLFADDFALINPNTLTCPIFRSQYDADLTKKLFRRIGILWRDAPPESEGSREQHPFVGNPWGIRFWTMFNLTTDSGLFRTEPGEDSLPLYEAKMIGQFDHRCNTFDFPGQDAFHECTDEEKKSPDYEPAPRYWVDRAEVVSALDSFAPGQPVPQYLMGWRDVTNVTNFRTEICSVFPLSAVGHSLPVFTLQSSPILRACFIGDANSIVHDWAARGKIGGLHLTFGYMKQLATLPPSAYTQADIDYIVPRVLELTYTSHSLKPWAEDLGYHGEPFRWDENRRAILRAELDARYARLYGLTRDELRYVLDPADLLGPDYPSETFRVLKEKELAQFNEYRTQRLVLEAWDCEEAANHIRKPSRALVRDLYLRSLVQHILLLESSRSMPFRTLVRAWAALSNPQAMTVLPLMPATASAWAAAYPDRLNGESIVETLKEMHTRRQVDLDKKGNVVLKTPPSFNADFAMDAALALKAERLTEGAAQAVLSEAEVAFQREIEEGVYADVQSA